MDTPMLDYTLSTAELGELRQAHRKMKEKRLADRLKAVYLLGSGWTALKVSEALLVDEDTVRNWFHLYDAGGVKKLLHWQVGGSKPYLSGAQQAILKQQVTENLFNTCKAVKQHIQQQFQVVHATRSVAALLGRLGFSRKKAKVVPGKADAAAQEAFIAYWGTLKAGLGEQDDVYFMDAMHPQHNTQAGYGWIAKGKDYCLRSNTGRQRLNINGALSFKQLSVTVRTEETINAQAAIRLLEDLECAQPEGKIHIIADNARYYRSRLVTAYLAKEGCRIQIHFLPPYSPNLNLIGRLWGFFKRKVIYNIYYPTFLEFKLATLDFFRGGGKHRDELKTLMADNFRVIKI
jgi:transposase